MPKPDKYTHHKIILEVQTQEAMTLHQAAGLVADLAKIGDHLNYGSNTGNPAGEPEYEILSINILDADELNGVAR